VSAAQSLTLQRIQPGFDECVAKPGERWSDMQRNPQSPPFASRPAFEKYLDKKLKLLSTNTSEFG